MRKQLKTCAQWLVPALLIMFLLETATLPFVFKFTYAGRSERVEHVLTYTTGRLVWNTALGVDKDGTARLSLFASRYGDSVRAENDEKLIAPGTDGFHIVRLKNDSEKRVGYTAVLYEIKSNPKLPLDVVLSGTGFSDTTSYHLPESAKGAKVLRAVSGSVGKGEIQDFDINWLWEFYDNEAQDRKDTEFGDMAAFGKAEDSIVGVYVVIEDDTACITPDRPNTGDVGVGMYLTLMGISGGLLILLFVSERRREAD